MATTVQFGHVIGLGQKPYLKRFNAGRATLRAHARQVVDAWFDGGFVGVGYPRNAFTTAFHTFTAQARHDAIRQKGLMTNWPLRRRIDSVATTKRQVTLDVLAPHGRPAGMTARFTLRFRTSGHARKRVTVTGRLFLTRNAHGLWRIFGYDVSKGAK